MFIKELLRARARVTQCHCFYFWPLTPEIFCFFHLNCTYSDFSNNALSWIRKARSATQGNPVRMKHNCDITWSNTLLLVWQAARHNCNVACSHAFTSYRLHNYWSYITVLGRNPVITRGVTVTLLSPLPDRNGLCQQGFCRFFKETSAARRCCKRHVCWFNTQGVY